MTKLTFDVDFNKDPEEILREIQERAKAEVAKRELKLKSASFLSKLHEKVNEEIGTDYKSINDLIRALTQFANPKLKDKISSTSSSGRRVTVSMNRDLFEEIKSKLSQPNPNKAAIARETGLSVVQVRKVASGGYDSKFSSQSSSRPTDQGELKPSSVTDSTQAPRTIDSIAEPESPQPIASPSLDLPPASPSLNEDISEAPSLELPPIASTSNEEDVTDDPEPVSLLPSPSLDLPPAPLSVPEPIAPPSPSSSEDDADVAPPEMPSIAPPSFGEDIADVPAPISPPPSPSLELPPSPLSAPEPIAPPSPSSTEDDAETAPHEPSPIAPSAPTLDLPPSPPSPPSPPQDEQDSPEPAVAPNKPLTPAGKPTLSLKPKGGISGGGKPGKPTLSLKSGKKKTGGLKITRPPMKPPSA